MSDIALYLVLALATALAAFVQGAIGIGFALIVAPILGLSHPELMPTALLMLMLPLNLFVSLRERRSIDWRGAGWITLGRLPGTLAGLGVLLVMSRGGLNLLIGLSTVVAVLAAWWAPAFSPRRGSCMTVGTITGVTETATGVGGPPLALLYQHRPGPELRATIAACFLLGELISLLSLALAGQLEMVQWLWALALLPPLLLGSVASRLLHQRLDASRLRQGVLLFALISGLVLMIPF
ncbi:MAG: sulfite exporter TauE/SafE family protein [Pseudomonadota bacterium]|jgi:hypothetical protein|nr:sulfite exporter TauE/SafE family protein [Pseudomonadota bacterium]MED5500660.1 sulfite exporter TauE/SafE family protein [Pseudomonadota bacterium]